MVRRYDPDHEATVVEVEADTIQEKGTFRKHNKHHSNRIIAIGNVEVTVRKQHPGAKDKEKRPDEGAVLSAPGKDSAITVDARRIEKVRKNGKRDNTTASKGVEIFGKMTRRPRK